MYPYLVHIEREELTDWRIPVSLDNEEFTTITAYNEYSVEVKSNLDLGKPADMETWYCSTEEQAMLLCKHLARICPNRNVNMYKLTGVTRSVPGPATFAKYNEKGLIPT